MEVLKPWGSYEVLYEFPGYKIKRLVIIPLQRLSLQSHENRSEHWIIETGYGIATLESVKIFLQRNDHLYIPKNSKHRLYNPSKEECLSVLEYAKGLCDEEDIIRYEDDYNRI